MKVLNSNIDTLVWHPALFGWGSMTQCVGIVSECHFSRLKGPFVLVSSVMCAQWRFYRLIGLIYSAHLTGSYI